MSLYKVFKKILAKLESPCIMVNKTCNEIGVANDVEWVKMHQQSITEKKHNKGISTETICWIQLSTTQIVMHMTNKLVPVFVQCKAHEHHGVGHNNVEIVDSLECSGDFLDFCAFWCLIHLAGYIAPRVKNGVRIHCTYLHIKPARGQMNDAANPGR